MASYEAGNFLTASRHNKNGWEKSNFLKENAADTSSSDDIFVPTSQVKRKMRRPRCPPARALVPKGQRNRAQLQLPVAVQQCIGRIVSEPYKTLALTWY